MGSLADAVLLLVAGTGLFWVGALQVSGNLRLTAHGVVPHFLDSLVPSVPTQIHFDANDESGEVNLTFLLTPALLIHRPPKKF